MYILYILHFILFTVASHRYRRGKEERRGASYGGGDGISVTERRNQDHRRRAQLRRPRQGARQRRPQGCVLHPPPLLLSLLLNSTSSFFISSRSVTRPHATDRRSLRFFLWSLLFSLIKLVCSGFRCRCCSWSPPRLISKMEAPSRFRTLWNRWIMRWSWPSSSGRRPAMSRRLPPWTTSEVLGSLPWGWLGFGFLLPKILNYFLFVTKEIFFKLRFETVQFCLCNWIKFYWRLKTYLC